MWVTTRENTEHWRPGGGSRRENTEHGGQDVGLHQGEYRTLAARKRVSTRDNMEHGGQDVGLQKREYGTLAARKSVSTRKYCIRNIGSYAVGH